MVNLGELIEVGSVGRIASIVVRQKVNELEHSLGKGDEPLASFFDDSQAGLHQVRWRFSHVNVGILGLHG